MLVTYGQKTYLNDLYLCQNWIYCKSINVFLTKQSEVLHKCNIDIQEVFKLIFVNTRVPQNRITEGTEMSVSYQNKNFFFGGRNNDLNTFIF